MTNTVKINSLELENVKRVKAVKLEPTQDGLTVIGGKNAQGKTSVLDAIAWTLGGNKFSPSNPQYDGSVLPPTLRVELSNGVIVERKGKNSDLKVTDPKGQKAGQTLLDSFIEELALNLPKFMGMNNKDKARTLLNIIGVEEQLVQYERQESQLYTQRLGIGQIADQKLKFAKEQEHYPDVPSELVSAQDLIKQQQEILARNGANQQKRNQAQQITFNKQMVANQMNGVDGTIANLNEQLLQIQARIADEQSKKASLMQQFQQLTNDELIAQKTVEQLVDESTAELEASIQNIELINAKIRKNLEKERALDEAKVYKDQYDSLTEQIEATRKAKFDLLKGANLPLEELFIEDGELTYKGQKWDNMSGSEQLKVATAIVRKLNPSCGFVLVDKTEQMDIETLNDFGKWASEQGLQIIATRVSTGDECTIWIEDGMGVDNPKAHQEVAKEEPTFDFKDWKQGGGF